MTTFNGTCLVITKYKSIWKGKKTDVQWEHFGSALNIQNFILLAQMCFQLIDEKMERKLTHSWSIVQLEVDYHKIFDAPQWLILTKWLWCKRHLTSGLWSILTNGGRAYGQGAWARADGLDHAQHYPGENKGLPCSPCTNILDTDFLEIFNEKGSIKSVPSQGSTMIPACWWVFHALRNLSDRIHQLTNTFWEHLPHSWAAKETQRDLRIVYYSKWGTDFPLHLE